MPLVRGRIIAETESTGRKKRTLDVLLWLVSPGDGRILAIFDELEQLRAEPLFCGVTFRMNSAVGMGSEPLGRRTRFSPPSFSSTRLLAALD